MTDAQEYKPTRSLVTQDSMDDPEEHVPPPLDALESPPESNEQVRQRAAAAVRTQCTHPIFLARIPAPGLVSADTGVSFS